MRPLLLIFSILLFVLAGTLTAVGWWLFTAPVAPPQAVTLQVAPGSHLARIAQNLEDQGVVRDALLLRALAKWHRQDQQIQAGQYSFLAAATPADILERLVRGDVDRTTLTIPEGFTQRQIIERIAAAGFGEATTLWQLVRDQDFINSVGIDAVHLEGYLFPETYSFVPGVSESVLLRMMVEQFHSRMTTELREAAAERGLTLHQHVTLASLIEKETGLVEEMPLVSSVFHNRLKANMRLQTDPTAVYDLEGFSGTVTRAHLANPSPYNTYIIRGLPPGPIASPGLAALTAAVFPATTDYYYFVSRRDGSHHFSRTLREHNNAVQRYLRNRR